VRPTATTLAASALALLLVLGAPPAAGTEGPPEPIVLQAGKILEVGGKSLSVGHTASVEMADWNNDGRMDLLIGTFSGGKVLLFLNTGGGADPSFDEGTTLMAGDVAIKTGFG
jgi:hypothetical protein